MGNKIYSKRMMRIYRTWN